jgi:hypothetical protein
MVVKCRNRSDLRGRVGIREGKTTKERRRLRIEVPGGCDEHVEEG